MGKPDWPLGALELKVLDLQREAEFYERFGLTRMAGDAAHAVLGAGDAPLLRLTALKEGRPRPRPTAGLYHFAILLPSEQELGGFLRRALEDKLPLTGTSDHLVSQALYFDDPEGSGIEVYEDRRATAAQVLGRHGARPHAPERQRPRREPGLLRIARDGGHGRGRRDHALHELGGLPPPPRDQPAGGARRRARGAGGQRAAEF